MGVAPKKEIELLNGVRTFGSLTLSKIQEEREAEHGTSAQYSFE